MTRPNILPTLLLSLTVPTLLVGHGGASASDIPCKPVSFAAIHVDGLLGDWRGVTPLRVASSSNVVFGHKEWSDSSDLSFDLFCNHDKRSLYLALRVTDEYLVRSRKARGDDHVMIQFGRHALTIFPGDLRSIPRRVRWGRKPKPRGVVIAEAMQTDGYSIEVKVPLKKVPGYRKGYPSLPLSVVVADSDSKAQMRVQTRISSGRSQVVFAQQRADLQAFLRDKGYGQHQIRWRKNIDVVGDQRVEQVVFVGRSLGIVGEDLPGGGYFYLDIQIRSPSDVKWIKAVDLNGDRKAEILIRHLERASSGFRELLAVYRFDSTNKFVRPLMHEVRKGQGSRVIENRVTLKRRRRRRRTPGGVDIIIDKPTARGFTQETFRERKASDAYPILLPWGEAKKRAFRFEGDEFSEL